MQKISNSIELKNAIELLEIENSINGQVLSDHLHYAYESLKPINILKKTIHNIVSSPNLVDNLLGAAIGTATGYVSKKIFVGTSDSMIKKLFGSILQFGVTKIVAQHPDAIKSLGQLLYKNIFTSKSREF